MQLFEMKTPSFLRAPGPFGLIVLFLLDPAFLYAQIKGRVENADNLAIAQARVTVEGSGEESFTDSNGFFAAESCSAPCTLTIAHPRFRAATVEVKQAQEDLLVILEAKQEVFETIEVTASRGDGDAFIPVSVTTTSIDASEDAAPPATLTELVEGVAGVAENGQAGIFQVFSIRGVSRQRVMSLISGMQIVGERRAGVSTSFLDPLLMGRVEVLRGPSSTYYGSGALGGVVQVFPQTFDALQIQGGYSGTGNERYLRAGWGDGDWSLGLAGRERDNGEAADGTELNDHFTQFSASLARSWRFDGKTVELTVLSAIADDIGKSNTSFPDSITNYPEEKHLLAKLSLRTDSGNSYSLYVHPNDLLTEDIEPGSGRNLVDNKAFDFGASWSRGWSAGEGWAGRLGADYFGRRDVTALEEGFDADGQRTLLQRTLNDATRDDLAFYATARRAWGGTTLEAGSRLTWQRQKNRGTSSSDDSAWTGFLGLTRPLGGGFELAANVGTGLRFPSLSERFFSGTTGRGEVIGNPDLDPESSLSTDLGLRWYGQRTFTSVSAFRLEIDDYIERIEIAPELLTFVNLTSGRILGFELEGFFQPTERWYFSWNGHLLDGEDRDGASLADIPPERLKLAARFTEGRWRAQLGLQLRGEKDNPGSGEKVIPAAELLSASLSFQVSPEVALTIHGNNLLDEVYFTSADRRSPVAEGRSAGLSFSWNPG